VKVTVCPSASISSLLIRINALTAKKILEEDEWTLTGARDLDNEEQGLGELIKTLRTGSRYIKCPVRVCGKCGSS
jgi:hypothetical protein